jgi:hypothetical protein
MTVAPGTLATAPDLIEPVLGFRQWRMDDDGLRSLHEETRWVTATLDARCKLHTHPDCCAPAPACSCGIYAWYRRVPRLASACTDHLVCGAIVLWGRVELHMTGMRGQHARVVALALPLVRGRKRRVLVDAAERLSVPAVPYSSVAAVAAKEGAPVPDVLNPRRGAPARLGGPLS